MGAGLARLGGPVWLDVTRLLTRVGRGALSGIDRVEMAHLVHLTKTCPDAKFLCRTTRGFLLLGPEGAIHLGSLAHGEAELGSADLLSRLTFRGKRPRHRAEAALRPYAVDRATKGGLKRLVTRHAPAIYLNTGHSNLTEGTLSALDGVPTAILIHDLIPITHPELVPADQPSNFASRIEAVRRHADLVIANSQDTASALVEHWRDARAPAISVASLGIELPQRDNAPKDATCFSMIGTIEPRKNHAVVLDAWTLLAEKLPPSKRPELLIIGAAGWQGDGILDRITSHPLNGTLIHYHGPLSDAEAAKILSRSTAVLYPTLAEGFGLPPFEALSYGARPICSDLPVLREGLGAHAVYVSPTDAYAWMETIKQYLAGSLPVPDTGLKLPTWQEHFDLVADALAPIT